MDLFDAWVWKSTLDYCPGTFLSSENYGQRIIANAAADLITRGCQSMNLGAK